METTRELIEKINLAFKDNDVNAFAELLADGVVWEMHRSKTGHTTMNGKETIRESMGGETGLPEQMHFEYTKIIVDGDTAAVEGVGAA